jgi:benzoyl-CoA reductase/2-hydroxyglutaryl-CoA dehydratase subunit BcrC/BadD/HgdB
MSHQAFISEWIAPRLQDPLFAAKSAANAGQRIVGYVGADIPVELILAANALPLRLRGKVNASTARADEYFESAFLPETRAIAEQWLSGELDFIDAVVLPRSGDSSQRLYYYLCELQRRKHCSGPTPLLYDVATISRNTSRDHTVNATHQLAASLHVDKAQLPPALARAARREKLLARLQSLRLDSSTLAGSVALRIARVAEFDWTEAFDQALGEWLADAPLVDTTKRILLGGSVPPDERLHLAVEAANGNIVAERVESSYASMTFNDDEALAALAHRHHTAASPAQQMLRSSNWIATQAQAACAHGVVIWLIEEDEALPWELASQIRSLQQAKVPVLALTRQRWLADATTLATITDFVRALEDAR